MKYIITANVDQIVTKEVHLLVESSSEEKAQERARDALQTYPGEVTSPGVLRIFTKKSHYWIPRSVAFTDIRKLTEEGPDEEN